MDRTSEWESYGRWWLPEAGNRRFPGRMKFSPTGGFTLEVSGQLHRALDLLQPTQVEQIRGRLGDGQDFTLVKPRIRIQSQSADGHQVQVAIAGTGVVGRHFDPRKEPRYERVTVRLSTLPEWFHAEWGEVSREREEGQREVTILRVLEGRYVDVPLDDAMTLTVTESRSESFGDQEVSFRSGAALVLKARHPQPLSFFLHRVSQFRALLAILTHEWSQIQSLEGHAASTDRRNGTPRSDVWFEPRELAHPGSRAHWFWMPAPYRDIETDFPAIVRMWISNQGALRQLTDLYLPVVFGPDMMEEFHFLGLCYALEGFHRLKYGGAYMPPEDYKAVEQALVGAIPAGVASDHRESLKNRVRFGYEYSLRKRLDDLMKGLPRAIQGRVCVRPAVFASDVADLRNRLTHRGAGEGAQADMIDRIPGLTHGLQKLVAALIFRELAFPESRITSALSKL